MNSEIASYIGLDIGGLSVKGIRLDPDGSVSGIVSRPTRGAEGADAVLGAVRSVLRELAGHGAVAAVGAGTPGAIDERGRIAGEAVNIPGWMGVDLRSAIETEIEAPVLIRNDGNMAAYGEWAARGGAARALLFVGLGTGIGGGFVENGRILGGIDDRAVEIGHVMIRPGGRLCTCGQHGCVEAYASGLSIGNMATELAREPDSAWAGSLLARELRNSGRHADAHEVYKAFAQGDALAKEVHARAADALAHATAMALAFLASDCVVFGGGVMAGAGALVGDVASRVPQYVYPTAYRDCRFELTLLGPAAGLLGAALYGASGQLSRDELFYLARAAQARDKSLSTAMPSQSQGDQASSPCCRNR